MDLGDLLSGTTGGLKGLLDAYKMKFERDAEENKWR